MLLIRIDCGSLSLFFCFLSIDFSGDGLILKGMIPFSEMRGLCRDH